MKNSLFLLSFFLPFIGFTQINDKNPSAKIEWVSELKGDFSFTEKWEFPLGVETKSDGKAGCADGGFCPERCYGMLDTEGIVLKDSAEAFYQLLDTTHIPFSIECEAWCYEYAGTNTVNISKADGVLYLVTDVNVATHSSLHLMIAGDKCVPFIELISIMPDHDANFYYQKGYIKIDKGLFKKNILKAEFDFEFDNTFEPDKKMYWKGEIYIPIKSEN